MLVDADIGALEWIADACARAMFQQAKKDAVIPFFDHIDRTVLLPGLHERLIFLKAIWCDTFLEDHQRAIQVVSNIPDILKVSDVRLLQTYFSLCSFKTSFVATLPIIERIIELCDEPAQLLQYRSVKAMYLMLLGDNGEARRLIIDALQGIDDTTFGKDDVYALCMLAHARSLKWWLSEDESDFKNACKAYERALSLNLSPFGFASIYWERGKLFSDHEMYNEAVLDLEYSLRHSFCPPAAIALFECYCHIDRMAEAEAILSRINEEPVPDECQLEFLHAKTVLAINKSDVEAVRKIIADVRQLKLGEFYFQRARDQLCLELLRSIENGQLSDSSSILNRLGRLFRWFASISQFLELKPNVWGIGLNINRILEQHENSGPEEIEVT